MSSEHELVTELKCACGHEQVNGIEGLLHLGQCPCCYLCRMANRLGELAQRIADRIIDMPWSERKRETAVSVIADELARAKVTL